MLGLSYIVPSEDHASLLLDWRTRPEISAQMFTDVAPDLDRQKAWLARSRLRDDFVHRILCVDGVPSGYISITVTEPAWGVGSLGAYSPEKTGRIGAAPLSFAHTLNHAFFALGLRKIVNQILGTNTRMIRGQPLLGYRPVGVLARHVVRGGQEIDVHLFEMLADDWRTIRDRFAVYDDLDGRAWP